MNVFMHWKTIFSCVQTFFAVLSSIVWVGRSWKGVFRKLEIKSGRVNGLAEPQSIDWVIHYFNIKQLLGVMLVLFQLYVLKKNHFEISQWISPSKKYFLSSYESKLIKFAQAKLTNKKPPFSNWEEFVKNSRQINKFWEAYE